MMLAIAGDSSPRWKSRCPFENNMHPVSPEPNKREPILGPNAGRVFWQFMFGLVFCSVVSWLLWRPFYDFAGYIIERIFR